MESLSAAPAAAADDDNDDDVTEALYLTVRRYEYQSRKTKRILWGQ